MSNSTLRSTTFSVLQDDIALYCVSSLVLFLTFSHLDNNNTDKDLAISKVVLPTLGHTVIMQKDNCTFGDF